MSDFLRLTDMTRRLDNFRDIQVVVYYEIRFIVFKYDIYTRIYTTQRYEAYSVGSNQYDYYTIPKLYF